MGIKLGEVDVGQIIENEFRIGVLERILESFVNKNPQLQKPTPEELDTIRNTVVELLKKKYPNSGISYIKE